MVADHQTKTNAHFVIPKFFWISFDFIVPYSNSSHFVFKSPLHSERKLAPMFATHLHYYVLFVWKDTNLEKCFAISENAEITAVGLQTLKQTSVMYSERKKGEKQNKDKSSTILLIKPLKSRRTSWIITTLQNRDAFWKWYPRPNL